MASELTDKIRAKYPDDYKDISDDNLEKLVLSKHPEYKDLTKKLTSNSGSETDNSEKATSEPVVKASGTELESNMRAPNNQGDSDIDQTPKVASQVNLEPLRATDQHNIIKPEEHESLLSKGWKLLNPSDNPEFKERMKKEGITSIQGPELMKIPGLSTLSDSIRNKSMSTGSYGIGFGGSVLADLIDMAGSGFDPRASGIKESPMDLFPSEHIPDAPIKPDFISHAEVPSDVAREFVSVGEEGNLLKKTESNKIPNPEDRLLELASKKQNMGLENPDLIDKNKPLSPPVNVSPKFNNMRMRSGPSLSDKLGKPRLTLTSDGTFVNNETGEMFDMRGHRIDANYSSVPGSLIDATDKMNNSEITHASGPNILDDERGFLGIGNGMPYFTKGPVGELGRTIIRNTQSKINGPIFGTIPNTLSEYNDYINKGQNNIEYMKKAWPYTIKEVINVLKDRANWGLKNYGHAENVPGQINQVKDTANYLNKLAEKLQNDPSPENFYKIKDELLQDVDNQRNILGDETGSININKSIPEDVKNTTFSDIINFPKALKASWDLSAPGRQGLGLIYRKEWWSAWNDMFTGMKSNEAFQATQKAISNRPLFKSFGDEPSFAQKVGLKLTNLGKLADREESFMSGIAEKFPGVKTSERAYTAYLNKLRADTFENLMSKYKVLGENGEYNMPLAKELANYINNATGRGSLGSLESSAVALNNAFFSPRFFASRLKLLGEGGKSVFTPSTYVFSQPSVRREYLKSLLAIAGVGASIGELAKMSGLALVEHDPTNSDFMKIKVGNTRLDPYAGMQQPVVLAARLLSGKSTSSVSGKTTDLDNPKYGQSNRMDVIGRFARSKESPTLSFIHGLLAGTDGAGNKFNVPEEVVQLFIPMVIQDLKQVSTENPNLIPYYHEEGLGFDNFDAGRGMLALPGIVGTGISNYGSK